MPWQGGAAAGLVASGRQAPLFLPGAAPCPEAAGWFRACAAQGRPEIHFLFLSGRLLVPDLREARCCLAWEDGCVFFGGTLPQRLCGQAWLFLFLTALF